MNQSDPAQAKWVKKYNYREAPSINSCELCSYAEEIDQDGQRGVESLVCAAGSDDTGKDFPVGFSNICDLFMSDMLDDEDEDGNEDD